MDAVRWTCCFLLSVALTGCQDYIVNFSDGGGDDATLGGDSGGDTGCSDIPFMYFGMISELDECFPIDLNQPECEGTYEQGALVARNYDCLEASLGDDCGPWQYDSNWEIVLLCGPFGGCGLPVVVDSVQDCGDRIEVVFSVYENCGGDCDAIIAMCRIIHLPNDPMPVHGIASLTDETPCP